MIGVIFFGLGFLVSVIVTGGVEEYETKGAISDLHKQYDNLDFLREINTFPTSGKYAAESRTLNI